MGESEKGVKDMAGGPMSAAHMAHKPCCCVQRVRHAFSFGVWMHGLVWWGGEVSSKRGSCPTQKGCARTPAATTAAARAHARQNVVVSGSLPHTAPLLQTGSRRAPGAPGSTVRCNKDASHLHGVHAPLVRGWFNQTERPQPCAWALIPSPGSQAAHSSQQALC